MQIYFCLQNAKLSDDLNTFWNHCRWGQNPGLGIHCGCWRVGGKWWDTFRRASMSSTNFTIKSVAPDLGRWGVMPLLVPSRKALKGCRGRGIEWGESAGEERSYFGSTQPLCVAGVHKPTPPNSVEIRPFPWTCHTNDHSPSTVLLTCVHARSNKQPLYCI